MYVNSKPISKFRKFCAQGVRTSNYGLAILSNGRRYRLAAVRTAENVVCLTRWFDTLALAQAAAEVKFPGVAVVRRTMPKVAKVAKAAKVA